MAQESLEFRRGGSEEQEALSGMLKNLVILMCECSEEKECDTRQDPERELSQMLCPSVGKPCKFQSQVFRVLSRLRGHTRSKVPGEEEVTHGK